MTHQRLVSAVLASSLVQRILLRASYWWHRSDERSITWVVGPDEIASMVKNISAALPQSHSVSLSPYRFAGTKYDSDATQSDGKRMIFAGHRLIVGPWLLGKLARRAEGFVYVGASGFLAAHDARNYEFAFLRNAGVKIACYFTGNDIRSPRLMRELQMSTGQENMGTYLADVNRVFATDEYEAQKKLVAEIADEYSDVIFNAKADQLSYLTRDTKPFIYFYPDEEFITGWEKFDSPERIVVVHAPSSPILKGTQVVRAAIGALRARGYEFEYVELIDRPHAEVVAELRRAHIALNEFYSFVPGVFGIEAMAAGCALLTSADSRIETDLAQGANQAWFVTGPQQVFDHLRHLLDDQNQIRDLAQRGHEWTWLHASTSRASEALRRSLHGG